MERRIETEDEPGEERQRECEEHGVDVERRRHGGGGKRRQDRVDEQQGGLGHGQADETASQRQRAGLDQQLGDQVAAAGADRQPHRHLAGASGAAHEQEVGDVGAGRQEHQAGHAKQQEQRRRRFRVHAALPLGARLDRQRLGLEPLQGLLAHAGLQRRLDVVEDGAVGRVEGGARLLDRDPRSQPAEHVGPVAAAVVEARPAGRQHLAHRDRHEHVRARAEGGPFEAAGRHADDGEGRAVDDQRLVQHRRILAELRGPEAVAEHHHRMRAGGAIVGRAEHAADRGLHAERREVAARHLRALGAERLPARRHVGAEQSVRGQPAEHLLHPLEVAEHGIAEGVVAVAGLVARGPAGLRPWRAEVHQPRRVLHRQRPEQHVVEDREDRGVRADAEGNRPHGHGGHERRLRQRAEREADIGQHGDSWLRLTIRAAGWFSVRPAAGPRWAAAARSASASAVRPPAP